MFDVAPEDSEKLEETSTNKTKPHQGGGQLTDEDFGDDEVERITGGEPENEKTSGSEEQEQMPPQSHPASSREEAKVAATSGTVYSD